MQFAVKLMLTKFPEAVAESEAFPDVADVSRVSLEEVKEELLALDKEVSATGALVKEHARLQRQRARVSVTCRRELSLSAVRVCAFVCLLVCCVCGSVCSLAG